MSITRLEFWDGHIPEAFTWTKMLLMPNSGGWYRGMCLLEVIWKVCVNREQQATADHHSTRCLTWLQTVEGDRDGNHGGKSGTETFMNSSLTDFPGIYQSAEIL